MTQEEIREAVRSGDLDKEQAACFWAWEFARQRLTLPGGKQIRAGVLRDYGMAISTAAAFRGRDMAYKLLFRRLFSRGENSAHLGLTDVESVC